MAFSLRSLKKKLQGGVDALRKPLPKPVQIDFNQFKSTPRVQAAVRQTPVVQPNTLISKVGSGVQELKEQLKPRSPLRQIGLQGYQPPQYFSQGAQRFTTSFKQPQDPVSRIVRRETAPQAKISKIIPKVDYTSRAGQQQAALDFTPAGVAGTVGSVGKQVIKKAKVVPKGFATKWGKGMAKEAQAFLDEAAQAGRKGVRHALVTRKVSTIAQKADDIIDEKRVKEAMQALRNGRIQPLVLDKAGNLLDGSHRLEAAKRMGIDELPVAVESRVQMLRDKGKFAGSKSMQRGAIDIGEGLEGIKETGRKLKRLITGKSLSSTPPTGKSKLPEPVLPKKSSELYTGDSSIGKIGQYTPEGTAGRLDRKSSPLVDPTTTAKQTLPQQGGKPLDLPVDPSASSPESVSQRSTAVNKIIQALKEAKPIRGKQEALYSAERSRRAARIAAVGSRVPGEQGYIQQLGQLKGELPRVNYEGIRGALKQADIDELFNTVEAANLPPFQKITGKGALAKILEGQVPTKGEISLLNEVFPSEFIKQVLGNRPLTTRLLEGAGDLLAVPRSLMSSVDFSAPLRQGVFLVGRPKQWVPAFKNMFKYFASDKAFKASVAQIRSRPTYQLMRDSGLAISDAGPIIGQREERFLSNLAEKIPLAGRAVKASNRAYTGFLNQLRADVFDDILKRSKDVGADKNLVAPSLAKFVNAATGRGDMGALNRASGVLSSVLFSPRLLFSRLNLLNPQFYYKLEPTVRKEALKSLITFAGMGTTVLTLAKLSGAEVGTDPRSADFGKIKVGDTRYDIWGGFQQPIRAAAQMIAGESVSSTTGLPYKLGEGYKPTTRLDIATRFLESKESPVASFVLGLFKGQNFMGDDFNVPEEAISRLVPLVVQDLIEMSEEEGPEGLLKGLPALFGVGTQTYGRQVPQATVTPKGELKVKATSPPGFAEKIANKFFPEKPKAKEEIKDTIDLLKEGTIDKETAKARIKQSLLQDVAKKVNAGDRSAITPMFVAELKKSLKSDIKSVANDYELTTEEKRDRVKLLIKNFKKTVGDQAPKKSQPISSKPTRNILQDLGPITGLNGSSLWKPGLDVDLRIGDPVPSPISGQVIASAQNGGFGNQVKVLGDDGREYWFSHLSKVIRPGQRIAAGQIVGLGGNSGNTIPGRGGDGSHLDLTVVQNGQFLPAPVVAQLLKSYA